MSRDSKRWLAVITLASVLAAWFPGCGNDEDDVIFQPPPIPPASTFVMDFSDFQAGGAKSAQAGGPHAPVAYTKNNWGWAAFNVAVWNAVLTLRLAIPVAAFLESFNHEPVRHTDGTWVWSYNFYVNTVLHLAELHGKVTGGTVEWNMYVSKQGEYEDFLWFTGVSDTAATEGSWTLNSDPANPTPLLGIPWHRNPAEGTGDIKYVNIIPDHAENGGYIFYGITDDTPFDAFYDIYNKGADNHTDIEWDRTAKNGRVSDPDHFVDDAWHCWDTTLEDVDCE
jgi:hypothetical protein